MADSFCAYCYEGVEHSCSAKLRSPITRETSDADVRERLQRLEKQYDALAREHAHLRASIPDLEEVREMRELVSRPDFYLSFYDESGDYFNKRPIRLPISKSKVVSVLNPFGPFLLRAFLTPDVFNEVVLVEQFFIGNRIFSALGPTTSLGNFKKIVAEQKTWRVPASLDITLQFKNTGSVEIEFYAAFVGKLEEEPPVVMVKQ